MPDQRKKGKVKLNVWLNDEDQRARLQEAAEALGFQNVTEFLKWIADKKGEGIEVSAKPPRG